MKTLILVVSGLFLTVGTAFPGDTPKTITIAYEDSNYYPWSKPDGTGVNLEIMRHVCKKIGVGVKLRSLPWRRCLALVEINEVDGVLNASFKPERARIAVYPMLPGSKPDPSRRTHTDGYALYRRKGEKVSWNGETIVDLRGNVVAQSSFSVVDLLRKRGVPVEDESKFLDVAFRKLLGGRAGAAALPTFSADHFLQTNPDYSNAIEKCRIEIVAMPYYLILSKSLVRRYPEMSKRIWDEIKKFRTSKERQVILAAFMKSEAERKK